MKYFNYLSTEKINRIFFKAPVPITIDSPVQELRYGLGGTLYMPPTTIDFHSIIVNKKISGLGSMVICLEDAIKDHEVELAEQALIAGLSELKKAMMSGLIDKAQLPFIFIRVRNASHLEKLTDRLCEFEDVFLGFVFPKFDQNNSEEFIQAFLKFKNKTVSPKYFMPILESEEIIYVERRTEALLKIKSDLDFVKDHVLNVRIGATDFCSNFGIRRSKDFTIYQIHTVRDCITEILNVFSRSSSEYVVSGSVWEYFDVNMRFLKPQLRATPFTERFGKLGELRRKKMLSANFDALIKELIEDKENGIVGKTVIHPSHLTIVNAIHVVTHEEYSDALSIMGEAQSGGVIRSEYSNKMNEIKPHINWARKLLMKAEIYGVLNKGFDYLSLLPQEEVESSEK
ncbi:MULTISPECIES: HpcH/HpaI aldolase/citrate lyase family protein [unclassified Fusibacter]|uniref:HpcH/HpaI aldolase/citrate lyase family protein n=1 Tax=unclassified Fusibacter TaxID=2624464 RepID=UPI001010CF5B|nr:MULTISPECIES: HpcH/HpaI aldolase/citrate lyase family protein [unclassified Fusibacter]MCK8058241.1 HpcH/HpaI aldolase/citrate lyase family protein [Fusibacter sp. A2]NPE20824.1 HpcH/HpaI aldolase/citrate lyase family protein [Fusibacter sp. A1]RXV63028.1 citrate lyase subunit beta [Fusibacter sp. A1]